MVEYFNGIDGIHGKAGSRARDGVECIGSMRRKLLGQQYIAHLLCEQWPDRAELDFSPAERGHGWRESVRSLPRTPPLSDEAISRESIYGDRGL